MTAPGPSRVAWTDHALAKAQLLGIALSDVEDAVLGGHDQRTRNTRAADWLVRSTRLTVAYNYPVGDDLTALLVTLWRQS